MNTLQVALGGQIPSNGRILETTIYINAKIIHVGANILI
jgi:hypothetical protein